MLKWSNYSFLMRNSRVIKYPESMKYVRNCSCEEEGSSKSPKSSMGNFFSSLTERQKNIPRNKITVVGVGQVGMACAVACLSYGITTDLCLFDVDKKKMMGEVLDLQHGALFLRSPRISPGNEIADTANSKLIIITAGARQKEGEKRPDLIGRNVVIFKSFISDLIKYSPETTLLIVSNPVDAMTYIAWKLSGLPSHKVLGGGTNLDTSRFRHLISAKLNINVKNAHGWIIGEHGDSSVPVWSGVNIAGVPLRAHLPQAGNEEDHEKWNEIHKETVDSAYKVIALKGYTSWAIGFSVGQLAESILRNSLRIHPVTTNLKGSYDVEDDIFASVPCILGESGVLAKVKIPLTDFETEQFKKSIEAIRSIISDISL